MNYLRKSLSRKSISRKSVSRRGKLEEEVEGNAQSARTPKSPPSGGSAPEHSERRKSMRQAFDSEAMSLEQKLRARSRTSIRRSGVFTSSEFTREPVGWEA